MVSVDFVAKAAKAVLKPLVAEHGFQEYGPKTYFRMCGKIGQFLALQKSAWGGGDFAVTYLIFILVPHRKFIGSVFTGGLPRGKPNDGWWKSVPQEAAQSSMLEVCTKFETSALPVFEQSSTLSGYVAAMKKFSDASPNAHFRADIGTALICDGKIAEGRGYIRRAEEEYRAFSAQFPDMPKPLWSDESADSMAKLSAAIEGGRHQELIDEWYRQSIVTLKIDKKWKS